MADDLDRRGRWWARTECKDCDEVIDPARAALRVSRCIGCQSAHERGVVR